MLQLITIDHAHQLSELVKHAISNTTMLANQKIQYKIEQEQVVLTGSVNSYYEKQVAQESVSRVNGVRQVDNQLTVEPAQREDVVLQTY